MRRIDENICKIRIWSVVGIRLVAVYIAASFFISVSASVVMSLLDPWQPTGGGMVFQLVVTCVSTVGTAIGVWFLAPWIADKLVSDYSQSCPKCRFSLEYFRADRCPECGLFLGEDFHAPPKAGESKPADS